MSVPKSKRNISPNEFDHKLYQVVNDVEDLIKYNFRTSQDIADKNRDFVTSISEALRRNVWELIRHIKVANALYPTYSFELEMRRLEQTKALGCCYSILTLYEIAFNRLHTRSDAGVLEVNNLNRQINSIKAWRTSDNKRFRSLKSSSRDLDPEDFDVPEDFKR